MAQISRGDYIPNPHYVAPLARTRAVIQAGGSVATAVGLASDAGALCYAYHESSETGDYTHLFKEGARVVGGWSGALAVGGACAEFATAHIAPALSKACARTVFGLYLAPLGPVASLAGVVVPSLVGSVAGSVVGGELAKKAVPFLREIFTAENIFAHLVPSILSSQLQGETKIDVPMSEKKVAERGPDAVSQYQNLLGATMREKQGFYRSTQKQTDALREKKEALARAREIDMKKIRLTHVTADILNKQDRAKDAYEKYVAAVRAKEAAAIQAALGRDFVQSTAAFGDAVSKNLSSAGYRTAGRVLSTVSNGLSAGLAAKSMGAAIGGFTKCAALGTATAGIGIAIAAFTTILGLCGDDDVSCSSNGLSELAAHLDGRFDRVESLIQKSTDAIRSDIRVLQQLMIQVFSEVRQLSTICLETLQSLYELNHFVREEAVVTAAQLKSIETHPLKFAQFMLEQYLVGAGKLPDQASFDMMKFWLVQNLHEPVVNASNCALLSSERVASMLQKQAEKNIVMPGFLALRLHQHFPHLNFNVYATLPPMPLFPDLSDLYLNALEKSGKMDREDYVSVCNKTKETIQLYLQFIDTLKKNLEIIQALFDQYTFYQGKNDKQHQPMMMEIKGLLKNIVPLLENKQFEEKLLVLDQSAKASAKSAQTPLDLWKSIQSLPEKERVKRLWEFFDMEFHPSRSHSKQLHPFLAGYTDYSNEQNNVWFLPIEEKALLDAMPKSVVFKSNCSGDLLAKNEAYRVIGKYYYKPGDTIQFGTAPYHNKPRPGLFYTEAMLLLSLACGYTHITWFTNEFERRSRFESREKRNDRYNLRKQLVTQYFVADWQGSTNVHEFYDTLPNTLPKEYEAILASAASGFFAPEKLRYALYYVALSAMGDYFCARSFALKDPKNPIDPYCVLFLTSIIGRFDIFETYAKQFQLPVDFNFSATAEGGTLTPLAFATKLGHQEVVDVLSDIPALKARLSGTAAIPSVKTALEFELEEKVKIIKDFEVYAASAIVVQDESDSDSSESEDNDADFTDELIQVTDVEDDDEQYENFEAETLKLCAQKGLAGGVVSFWRKPTEVPALNKAGCRVRECDVFGNLAEQRLFSKSLKAHGINVRKTTIGDTENLAVYLPTKDLVRRR